jgi:hypothetical protein
MKTLRTILILLMCLVASMATHAQSTVQVLWNFANYTGQSNMVTRLTVQPIEPYPVVNGSYYTGPPVIFYPGNSATITNGYVGTNMVVQSLLRLTISGPGFSLVKTNFFPSYLTNLSGPFNAAVYDVAGVQIMNNVLIGIYFTLTNLNGDTFVTNATLLNGLAGAATLNSTPSVGVTVAGSPPSATIALTATNAATLTGALPVAVLPSAIQPLSSNNAAGLTNLAISGSAVTTNSNGSLTITGGTNSGTLLNGISGNGTLTNDTTLSQSLTGGTITLSAAPMGAAVSNAIAAASNAVSLHFVPVSTTNSSAQITPTNTEYNIMAYGGSPDGGVSDNSPALTATIAALPLGGTIRIPSTPQRFVFKTPVVINKPCTIIGDGAGSFSDVSFPFWFGATTIETTSTSNWMWMVVTNAVQIKGISFYNDNFYDTNGGAILISNSATRLGKVDIMDCAFYGFYCPVYRHDGFGWVDRNNIFEAFHLCGERIDDNVQYDGGGWEMDGDKFQETTSYATAAVIINGGGAGNLHDCITSGEGGSGFSFTNSILIDVTHPQSGGAYGTSRLNIHHNLFGSSLGDTVCGKSDGGGTWWDIDLNHNEYSSFWSNGVPIHLAQGVGNYSHIEDETVLDVYTLGNIGSNYLISLAGVTNVSIGNVMVDSSVQNTYVTDSKCINIWGMGNLQVQNTILGAGPTTGGFAPTLLATNYGAVNELLMSADTADYNDIGFWWKGLRQWDITCQATLAFYDYNNTRNAAYFDGLDNFVVQYGNLSVLSGNTYTSGTNFSAVSAPTNGVYVGSNSIAGIAGNLVRPTNALASVYIANNLVGQITTGSTRRMTPYNDDDVSGIAFYGLDDDSSGFSAPYPIAVFSGYGATWFPAAGSGVGWDDSGNATFNSVNASAIESITNALNAFTRTMGQVLTNLFQPTNNNLTLLSELGSGPGVITNSSSTSTPSFSYVQVGGGGGGSGTVTSAGLNVDSAGVLASISGSPITTSGSFTPTFSAQIQLLNTNDAINQTNYLIANLAAGALAPGYVYNTGTGTITTNNYDGRHLTNLTAARVQGWSNIYDFGAYGNGVSISNAIFTSASAHMKTPWGQNQWTAADVGKNVEAFGLSSGAPLLSIPATITAYNYPTDVTISVTSSVTESLVRADYGNDDTPAFNAAMLAMSNYNIGVKVPPGTYFIDGPFNAILFTGTGTNTGYSQITLPVESLSTNAPITVDLEGEISPAPSLNNIQGTTEPMSMSGAILLSSRMPPEPSNCCVIGFPTPVQNSQWPFSAANIVIKKLTIRMYNQPQASAIDMNGASMAKIEDDVVDVGTPLTLLTTAVTNHFAYGIRTPAIVNWTDNTLVTTRVEGFYNAYGIGEHVDAFNIQAMFCINAMTLPGGEHTIHISKLLEQECNCGIYASHESTLYTHQALIIDDWDVEHGALTGALAQFNTSEDLYDPSSVLTGHAYFHSVLSNSGVDNSYNGGGETSFVVTIY